MDRIKQSQTRGEGKTTAQARGRVDRHHRNLFPSAGLLRSGDPCHILLSQYKVMSEELKTHENEFIICHQTQRHI